MFKTFFQWVIYSSKDPQKFALTLKAGIPFLMLLGLGKYITANDTSTLIDTLANSIVLLTQFATGIIAGWGILRKVYLTATGQLQ